MAGQRIVVPERHPGEAAQQPSAIPSGGWKEILNRTKAEIKKAEINAEMERQTRTDTTIGEARPMGQRGADPADTTPADVRK